MQKIMKWIRTGTVTLISVGVILVMLVWLAGGFHEKIQPGPTEVGKSVLKGIDTIEVKSRVMPVMEDAVGTVRASHETEVGAKVLARVLSVQCQAGDRVEAGQVLVELEKGDLVARVSQAKADVEAAQALLDQAQTNYGRIQRLRETDSASELEITTATNDLNGAKARLEKARAGLLEAEANADYATIRSPVTGVVIDKAVSVGDMVRPGQTVARLYDELQLVATVRESLATELSVSQQLPVTLEALDIHCKGTISEIVPESDVLSRAFHVKVTGPCPPGVIPGMFGRLHIPVGNRSELRIPLLAVRQVGQIPFVYRVASEGATEKAIERTYIQIADVDQDLAEAVIASGLSEGDWIVASPDSIDQ